MTPDKRRIPAAPRRGKITVRLSKSSIGVAWRLCPGSWEGLCQSSADIRPTALGGALGNGFGPSRVDRSRPAILTHPGGGDNVPKLHRLPSTALSEPCVQRTARILHNSPSSTYAMVHASAPLRPLSMCLSPSPTSRDPRHIASAHKLGFLHRPCPRQKEARSSGVTPEDLAS